MKCKQCNSENVTKRGKKHGHQRYQCNECGKYSTYTEENNQQSNSSSYEEGRDFINIICSSPRIISEEELIEQFKVDITKWEIDSFQIKTSEGYRKDKQVDWHVHGKKVDGDSVDSGKMLVVPLFHVRAKFVRRQSLNKKIVDDIFENLKVKNLSPIKVISSQYDKNGSYVIVPIADLHLGLSTTKQVEGNDYNMELAEQYFYDIISQTKDRLKGRKVKEIIFLVGNDFLNSDNLQNTTEKGTLQDTNTSWFYLIDKAIELIIKGTNSLLEISNVKIINVPSNHDRHSMYGVMKAIEQYFKDNKNVEIDNTPIYTKYKMVGKLLLALTHDIDVKRALDVVTTDAKEFWSESTHVVWLLGHLHKAIQYEQRGVMEIYRLPTVSGNSRWASENHYVQSDKRTQLFVIDENDGILDVMNIIVK